MTRKPELLALTSLRFFACMMIVLLHCKLYFPWTWLNSLPATLVHGVSFFFVMSGFILAYVYGNAEQFSYLSFLRNRVARLYPVHIFCLLAMLLLIPSHSLTFSGTGFFSRVVVFISNITLTHSLIPFFAYNFSYNAVSWCVSTEMVFYFLFPIFLLFLKRNIALGLLFSVTPLLCLSMLNAVYPIRGASDSPYEFSISQLIYINPFMRMCEFYIGMLGWVAMERLQLISSNPAKNRALCTCVELVTICTLVVWLQYGFDHTIPIVTKYFGSEVFSYWLKNASSAWIFIITIIVFANGNGMVSAVLACRPLVWLGRMSFPIFMTHQILQKYIVIFYKEQVSAPVFFLILLTLSTVVYYTVEEPLRNLIVRKRPRSV